MTASPFGDGCTLALFGAKVNAVLCAVFHFSKIDRNRRELEKLFCENLKDFRSRMYDRAEKGQYSRVNTNARKGAGVWIRRNGCGDL